MAMKTVGRSVNVQVLKSTQTEQQHPNDVVSLQACMKSFVNAPMEMVGMEDILKSAGKSIATSFWMGKRKKKTQQ